MKKQNCVKVWPFLELLKERLASSLISDFIIQSTAVILKEMADGVLEVTRTLPGGLQSGFWPSDEAAVTLPAGLLPAS